MLVFKARRKNPTAGPQLTASQRRIMKIMADAMEEVRRQVIRDEPKILDVLLHGPDSRIPSLVSNDPWWKAQRLIADELFAELIAAGRRTGSSFPKIQKATVSYRFDAERPDAAAWAEKEAGNLIVEVTQGQVDMVRDYVSRSQMGEFTVPQVARNLRDVVGLTSQQSGWVDNYRSRFISDRLAAGDTLEQAMRAAAGPTERYQKRIHKYRTETIARTEILRAANEGRNQAWQQGIEEGYISPAAQKQWATEPDACEICIPLDGESVPITGEFPDGDPPLHPNCRCDVLMVDVDVSDYENMTWDEIDAELDQLLSETPAGQNDLADMIGGNTYSDLPNEKDWLASLSEDEVKALSDYTGKGGNYSADVLNDALRNNDLTIDQLSRVNNIDNAISSAIEQGVTSGDMPLWRGQSLEPPVSLLGMSEDQVFDSVADYASEIYRPGSVLDIGRGGFISTSTDVTPALDASISRTSPGIIFEIEPTSGAPLQGLTKYDDEFEILLPRNQMFEVVGIDRRKIFIDSGLDERIRTVVRLRPIRP